MCVNKQLAAAFQAATMPFAAMTSAFQINWLVLLLLLLLHVCLSACLPRATWASDDVRNRLAFGRQYNKSLN
jgi:hypothetical protein